MEKKISVSFPGNKRVDATFGGFTVQTDQLPHNGGDGSAPQPFDLFFVALATCAGISALDYCHEHALATEGLDVTLVAQRHPKEPRYDQVRIEVTLPPSLPTEHVQPLRAEVENCSVKRHVLEPPTFEVVLKSAS